MRNLSEFTQWSRNTDYKVECIFLFAYWITRIVDGRISQFSLFLVKCSTSSRNTWLFELFRNKFIFVNIEFWYLRDSDCCSLYVISWLISAPCVSLRLCHVKYVYISLFLVMSSRRSWRHVKPLQRLQILKIISFEWLQRMTVNDLWVHQWFPVEFDARRRIFNSELAFLHTFY